MNQKTSNLNLVESVLELCASLVGTASLGHEDIDDLEDNYNPEAEPYKAGLEPGDVFSLLKMELTLLDTFWRTDLFKDLVQAALDHLGFKLERPDTSEEDGRQELYEAFSLLIGFGETFVELYERLLPLHEELEKKPVQIPSEFWEDSPAVLEELKTTGEIFQLQALVVLRGLKGEWRQFEKSKKSLKEMYL